MDHDAGGHKHAWKLLDGLGEVAAEVYHLKQERVLFSSLRFAARAIDSPAAIHLHLMILISALIRIRGKGQVLQCF